MEHAVAPLPSDNAMKRPSSVCSAFSFASDGDVP
jgi:hypothetical protein